MIVHEQYFEWVIDAPEYLSEKYNFVMKGGKFYGTKIYKRF